MQFIEWRFSKSPISSFSAVESSFAALGYFFLFLRTPLVTILCSEIIIGWRGIFKKSVYEYKQTSLRPSRSSNLPNGALRTSWLPIFFFRIHRDEEYRRKAFTNLKKFVKYRHGLRRAYSAKCKCVICESENLDLLASYFLFIIAARNI